MTEKIELIKTDEIREQLDYIVCRLSEIENSIVKLKELGITLNI